MLYLVSTPIGNLEDITLRAIKILSACDYILTEDTRNSQFLLDHILPKETPKKKLVSFHKFNEKKMEDKILTDLKNSKDIAIISDGGTPIINDPGFSLIQKCIEENIKVTAIPGACSIIDAVVLSGFDSSTFQFIGFLPKKENELEKTLKKTLHFQGLTICFESPKRIIETLKMIDRLDPEREVAIARELTKKFEEIIRDTPSNIIKHFQSSPLGEMVLLISKKETDFKDIPLEEMLYILKNEYGLSSKEALKTGAKLLKEKKNELYKKTKLK